MTLTRSTSVPNLPSMLHHSIHQLRKTTSEFNLTSVKNVPAGLRTNDPSVLNTAHPPSSDVLEALSQSSACAAPSDPIAPVNCFAVYIDVLEKSDLPKDEIDGAIIGLKFFMRAHQRWNSINFYLSNKNYTDLQKKSFFMEVTGLIVHIRGPNETTLTDFILSQLPLIFNQSKLNVDSWRNNPNLLCKRFNSPDICLEGRHRHFFESLFSKKEGEKTKINISIDKEGNLLNYLNEYCTELNLGNNPTAFRAWFITQEGAIGGETSEGKITMDDLNMFIIYATEKLYILEEEKT